MRIVHNSVYEVTRHNSACVGGAASFKQDVFTSPINSPCLRIE